VRFASESQGSLKSANLIIFAISEEEAGCENRQTGAGRGFARIDDGEGKI